MQQRKFREANNSSVTQELLGIFEPEFPLHRTCSETHKFTESYIPTNALIAYHILV